jgi:agmatine deiminase
MAKQLTSTPKSDGFRMPGEFEPHQGCWMIWPERTDNWRLGAKPAQKAFGAVAAAIARFEPVTMCVSQSQYTAAREALPAHIRVIEMSNNDSWMRDVGPTFVVNAHGDIRAVDWAFNAWGGLVDGLYFPWDQDDKIARKVCEIEGVDTYRTDDFVLEGGSIHVDGEGTAIVTQACLLSKGRNPHLNQQQIEENLKNYLNVEKVIWLPNGIYLDETNEHVDNIIHYCGPATVVLAWTDDQTDPQYPFSQAAFEILAAETDAKGRPFTIYKLHIPQTVLITPEESEGVDTVNGTLPRNEGDRMAASYANFYIANNGVIFPAFGDAIHDEEARLILQKVFPDREVVGVYAREILLGGGNIHCITQQQPKPTFGGKS